MLPREVNTGGDGANAEGPTPNAEFGLWHSALDVRRSALDVCCDEASGSDFLYPYDECLCRFIRRAAGRRSCQSTQRYRRPSLGSMVFELSARTEERRLGANR